MFMFFIHTKIKSSIQVIQAIWEIVLKNTKWEKFIQQGIEDLWSLFIMRRIETKMMHREGNVI